MKRSFILLICVAGIWDTVMPFCRADLKPDELFALMRASRSRYVSIEATMEIRGFYLTDEKQDNPALMYSQETIYRRAGSIVYAECITKTFSETGSQNQFFKEIALLTPQSKKHYLEQLPGNKYPKGRIDKNGDNELEGWMSMTPDAVMWYDLTMFKVENSRYEFLKKNPDKTAITVDGKDQNYILETPVGIEENAPRFRYTVDSSKDYMPVVREWLDWDKTLIQKEVRGDYRQVNGLWAPFRYGIYDPGDKLAADITIKSLSLNQPIAPEKLAFEYPAGTRVHNGILGVSYTAGATNNESDKQPTGGDSNAPSTILAPPATDAQLAQSMLKAQDLIASEKHAASQTAPVIIPIEVIPSYVWVLPGKNEYILSVNSKADKKLELVKHSIEAKGLILDAVENQISSSSRIKVVIERPTSLKGYADGVMTLEFSDQKANIHFVAAPLE